MVCEGKQAANIFSSNISAIVTKTAHTITLADSTLIRLDMPDAEWQRIPKDQPFVVIANRQQAGVDELLLAHIFNEQSSLVKLNDIKIFTSKDLKYSYKERYEQLRSLRWPLPSPVLPLEKPDALEQAIAEGYSIALFIDYLTDKFWKLPQQQYLKSLFKVIKKLGVPIVPLHIVYASAGKLAGTAQCVQLRVGQPVKVSDQQKFDKVNRFRKFIQSKLFALGSALEVKAFFEQNPLADGNQEAIIEPVSQQLLEADIQQLSFRHLISSQGNFDVFVVSTTEIPNIINEIGRLRELTFRSVGEGTGKCYDLDEFDLYYDQLFIWDRVAKRVVGGYRLGRGEDIINKYGVEGFYIHSLFKIKPPFFEIMKQSVELGRSFIIEDYQRKRLPLFLLWRGILFFLLRNPQYRYLYGPLSISKYYSDISKSIIVAFVKAFYYNKELAQYLTPRKPFKLKLEKVDIKVLLENFKGNLGNLDQFIEDIEPQHFKLPILLKQYIRQNARFISFNIDPNFSDALDGFMILDLNDVPYATIEALKNDNQ